MEVIRGPPLRKAGGLFQQRCNWGDATELNPVFLPEKRVLRKNLGERGIWGKEGRLPIVQGPQVQKKKVCHEEYGKDLRNLQGNLEALFSIDENHVEGGP